MNDIGGKELRDYLLKKWNGEEVGGAVNATVDGKRITLARLNEQGMYELTMLGSFWETRTQTVEVEVVSADEPAPEELKAELNDTVELTTTIATKPKRGVRRPKVEQLEI